MADSASDPHFDIERALRREAEAERDRLFLESQQWHGQADIYKAALERIEYISSRGYTMSYAAENARKNTHDIAHQALTLNTRNSAPGGDAEDISPR